MFRAAQLVVRNKFVLIAVIAVAFIAFGHNGSGGKSVNPWGTDAVQAEQASANEGYGQKAFGAVAGAAKQYAGVDISSVAPDKLGSQTVDNWKKTGEAAQRANGN